MMAATDRPVCHHRCVLRGSYPLRALHAVLIAPAIHPLNVIRPVHIRPLGVSRRWQMIVVIGSRPREVALSEVGVYKLHMVSLGAVVVVGLLGEGAGFFLLCSPARLVLLRCHGVQIDLHVPRRGVVFAADMLLFPIIQAHAATPPSFMCIPPSPACIRAISTVVCRQAHPCFMACLLTYCWYTSPLRPLGRNENSLRHRRKQVSLQPARPRRSHGATASGRQIVVFSIKIGASIFSLAAS